ncbi:GNAT family N-acetyltransferase [Streptomyces sp. NPDC057638]|uniref:GNAT family N-acetyltransferase n=1 Tax=Streptomyces sp. NPDC057638 TaxID=3346190 RepID=UPI00367F09CD
MIDYGYRDRSERRVALFQVDDENWRAVADVVPADDQRRFVPPSAARYLLLSLREEVWNSLAVHADGTVVGHVMWARDDDGSYWIGGMLIDAGAQGTGVGRAAVRTLMRWLAERADCQELRLSYEPDNTVAAALYSSLGFRATEESEGDEVVASLSARDALVAVTG